MISFKSYIDFATNAPRYGPLQDPDTLRAMSQSYYGLGGCEDWLKACYATGDSSASNVICRTADTYCVIGILFCCLSVTKRSFQQLYVEAPAANGLYEYDLRQTVAPYCPLDYFEPYLNLDSVKEAIGAEVPFVLSSDCVGNMFNDTGDVSCYSELRRSVYTESNAGC
jgi:hypothetical protein